MAWFLDGLKAEDGSTVSISKSAMFGDSAYSEDINKVIGRLTMDIAGNKANRRAGNYNKYGRGKKPKYSVNKVETAKPNVPSKPSRNPPGIDVSGPTKWFDKDDFHRLPPEWKRYCSHKRYEAYQKKKKADGKDSDEKKGTGKNNNRNRNKRTNKYIKEVIAKQSAELEAKFEQKLATVSSVSSANSSHGVSFISSV